MKALYVLKAFSAEARDEGRFRDATLKFARQHIRAAVNTELLVLVDLLVTPTIFCLVLYAGYAWFHLEVAVLFVYLFGLKRIAPSVSAINTRRNAVHSYMAGLRRVRDILEVPDPTPVASGPRPLTALPETITFEQVSYRYHQAAEPAVRELSLTLRRGERIALVGQSGGGKSTVLNLLLRLQDPTVGRVLADGVDVREYDLRDWHRLIGLVTQDAVLITDTVRENLCYGLERPVTQAELEEAARAAQAHEFILTLPQGYDTIIGEDAVGMSGGQRQRLGIARAFLRRPQLLILDEPTSALDPVTEKEVHAAMDQLASNRTVVTVTHRLATIRSVDRIYVIERGQLVAVGTHDELLASSPEYRLYYETQVS
jgi:ABC-type multidrug transport system fused ATPase/permease subunit